ncbi:(d)CMP kinase [Rubrobacter indicoceani]|uniref:(d)CMP kinase n=1 Tax=Rubrobacter indicoceani TaxID=2051957 RepID=UPI000E5A55F5|nr:(d)CMP kinase [Rubrobacter indicoceani]
MEGIVIAIDGPAGSGKSSVAREIASRLGLVNLNTGATYRAVALLALEEGIVSGGGESTGGDLVSLARRVALHGETVSIDGEAVRDAALRTPEVSAEASKISSGKKLREVLVEIQREAASEARRQGGAVVEGRDIGTVVLPDAEVKVFLSASAEERAMRRARQSGRVGELERIKGAMAERDRQDSERETSPLRPASGAVSLDTTGMSFEEVVSEILSLVEKSRRTASR